MQEEICGISRIGLWGKSCVGCKSQQEAAMRYVCKGNALCQKGHQHHSTFQPAQQLQGFYIKSNFFTHLLGKLFPSGALVTFHCC